MAKKRSGSLLSSYRKKRRNNRSVLLILAALLIIAGLAVLALWATGVIGEGPGLFSTKTPTPTMTLTPTPVTPTSTATITSTPTETPTIHPPPHLTDLLITSFKQMILSVPILLRSLMLTWTCCSTSTGLVWVINVSSAKATSSRSRLPGSKCLPPRWSQRIWLWVPSSTTMSNLVPPWLL